jgi:GntR family transcriptional regulator
MSCCLVARLGLTPTDDFSGSLYALLRNRGVRLSDADQIIGAVTATAEQVRLLRCARSTALLKVDRVTFDEKGRGVEHVVGYYRADRYQYHLRLGSTSLGEGYIR